MSLLVQGNFALSQPRIYTPSSLLLAGVVVAVLGSIKMFGKVGSIGFIASICTGGTAFLVSACALLYFARKENRNPSLLSRWHVQKQGMEMVKVGEGKITMGQGEYIVFSQLPSGEKRALSLEEYAEVRKILRKFSPIAMAKAGLNAEVEKRDLLIQNELMELNKNYKAVFIPSTLYEMIYIRQCLEEDINAKEDCPFLAEEGTYRRYQELFPSILEQRRNNGCWHLCHYTDQEEIRERGIQNIAYRLNCLIVESFDPPEGGWSYQELADLVEREVQYLRTHYDRAGDFTFLNSGHVSVVGNFCFQGEGGYSTRYPMGVRDEEDAHIIRNAARLDCSEAARTVTILYRGSDFQKDAPLVWNDEQQAYSLSFGKSLFSGFLFDQSASPNFFTRKKKNDATAYLVPFNTTLFYLPDDIIGQWCGEGEDFHARSCAWQDFPLQNLRGFDFAKRAYQKDYLTSPLPREEFLEAFLDCKRKAIQLKPQN